MDDYLCQQLRAQWHSSGDMWYYAVDYVDDRAAKLAWERVHGVAKQHHIYVSSRRMVWHHLLNVVVVHTDAPPTEQQQQRIKQALADGIPVDLPAPLLEDLEQRRAAATIDAAMADTRELVRHPNERTGKLHEFSQDAIDRHLSKLRERFPFFVDYYHSTLPFNLHFRLESLNGEPYLKAYEKQLTSSEMYRFTETARAMHAAVSEENTTWIDWQQDVWIEHDRPFEIWAGQPIQAIFANKVAGPQTYNPYSHPWWNITAIDAAGQHALVMLYDDKEKTYDPTVDYSCPQNECQDFGVDMSGGVALARQPCDLCRERADKLAMWLHTALRMLRRDFATSANPKSFKTGEQVTKRTVLVPRQHGKGAPKEKTVEQRRLYTIVSYDVSVSERRIETPAKPEEEKRQSWLSLHGEEHRIYELRAVPTHERHYRGPYWDRLIGKCMGQVQSGSSGTVELDGVIYQVDISLDGEVTVKRTIEVPNGRYVPLLRPEYKKPTIKKATAKRFEEQH